MQRSFTAEILDGDDVPPEIVEEAHRALSRTHRLLGNHAAVLRVLRRGVSPGRVLDIGCGHGGLLRKIHKATGADVVGVDLQPPDQTPIPILKRDAVQDPLPQADVAVCVCMMHHLSDDEFIALIRNVGRSCGRFIILDLVRHPVPLALFRVAAPLALLPRINVLDGSQSIRRSFTGPEFRALIAKALAGTDAQFTHRVSPLWIRQIADIRFAT